MAGLLEFLNTDDARLGLGLLAAGGPSTVPMSVGQRVAGALQGMDADKQQKLRLGLLQSQIDDNASQAQARIAQATAAQRKQEAMDAWMARFQGGGAGGGSAGGGIQNMSANDIAAARLAGLPDLTPLWQATRPEMVEVAPGMWADKKTIQPGVNQQALAARRNDRIDQSDIGMRGEFVDMKGPDDRIYKVPKSSLVGSPAPAPLPMLPPGAVGGGGGPVNGQPIARPMAARPEDTDRAMIYAQERRDLAQRLAQAQASGDPASIARAQSDVAGLEKEIQSNRIALPAMGAGPVAAVPAGMPAGAIPSGMSRAETDAAEIRKALTLEQGKTDITPTASKTTKYNQANDAIGIIDKALRHPGLPVATGLSGSLDPRNYINGTNAKDFQVVLDQLKGGAFLTAFNDLKGGGAITEAEGRKAEDAIARLSRAQTTESFKEALTDYRAILERGIKNAGGAPSSATGSGVDAKSEPPKGKIVDTLPTPNASNKGQRIRDTTTGKILVSNGLQWKEQ